MHRPLRPCAPAGDHQRRAGTRRPTSNQSGDLGRRIPAVVPNPRPTRRDAGPAIPYPTPEIATRRSATRAQPARDFVERACRDTQGKRPPRHGRGRVSRPARSGSWSQSRRVRRSTSSATPTRASRARSRTRRSSPTCRTSSSKGWSSPAYTSAPKRRSSTSATSTQPEQMRLRGGAAARVRRGVLGKNGCHRLEVRHRDLRLARRLHPRRGDRAARSAGRQARRTAEQAALPRHARPVTASRR